MLMHPFSFPLKKTESSELESCPEPFTYWWLSLMSFLPSVHPYLSATWYSVNSRYPASLWVKAFQLGGWGCSRKLCPFFKVWSSLWEFCPVKMTFLHWRWEETYLQCALWSVGNLGGLCTNCGSWDSFSRTKNPADEWQHLTLLHQKKQYCLWDPEDVWRNSLIIVTGKVKWCADTIFLLFCKHFKR